jgi:hypothetical protein
VIFAAIVETPESLVPRREGGLLRWAVSAMTFAGALAFFASRAVRRLRARAAKRSPDQRR